MNGHLRRLRGWAVHHVAVVDGAAAVALTALALVELLGGRADVEGPWWAQAVCFAAMTGAVALRRRAVVVAAAVCGVGLVVSELLGDAPVVAGLLALLVVLYSAGAHGPGRRGVAALLVLIAALMAYPLTEPAARTVQDLVGNLAIFGGVWGLGRLVRHQRRREAALTRARALLDAARDRDRHAAVLAERARIARELHDVVAHAVSMMVLQAGAARAVLDATSPAREPLLDVEAAGRQALEDLHRMLGLLRSEGPDTSSPSSADRSPTPDLTALPSLLAGLRRAGLDARFEEVGRPVDVPAGVTHCAYRVVQEALTNVLKHAGSGRADVVVRYGTAALVVEVRDAGGERAPLARLPSGGSGLLGLQERVAVYGGRLRAGPLSPGWEVVAELPYAPAAVPAQATA